jgi:hypothetical protein
MRETGFLHLMYNQAPSTKKPMEAMLQASTFSAMIQACPDGGKLFIQNAIKRNEGVIKPSAHNAAVDSHRSGKNRAIEIPRMTATIVVGICSQIKPNHPASVVELTSAIHSAIGLLKSSAIQRLERTHSLISEAVMPITTGKIMRLNFIHAPTVLILAFSFVQGKSVSFILQFSSASIRV